MNRKMLAQMQSKKVRVRPIARRFDEGGKELEERDDIWLIQDASLVMITLSNTYTGHLLPLGSDHVREYLSDVPGKTDGFLRLKSQIMLQGKDISIEPLDDRGVPVRSASQMANKSIEDLDEVLRVASGVIIEGPTPIFPSDFAGACGITVYPFTAYLRNERKSVSYSSGSIIGLAPDVTYYVYADDPKRSGGAVTYHATTIRYRALSGSERLYLGRIRTGRTKSG